MDSSNIKIFLFGSPGIGFSSYPSHFVDKVKNLDNSKSSKSTTCIYSIEGERSTVKYCEYGLAGKGQHGNVRGGRNFGIYIEILGHKLNRDGMNKIVPYIEEFIKEGIISNINVDMFNLHNDVKHYTIFSFDDMSPTLDRLIAKFKENFLSDFKDKVIGILGHDKVIYDLCKPKLVPDFKYSDYQKTSYDQDKGVINSSRESPLEQVKKERKRSTKLLPVLIALILAMAGIGTIAYLLGKNSVLSKEVARHRTKIEATDKEERIAKNEPKDFAIEPENPKNEKKSQVKNSTKVDELFKNSGSKNALIQKDNDLCLNKSSFEFEIKKSDYTISNKEDLISEITDFVFNHTSFEKTFQMTKDQLRDNINTYNAEEWKNFDRELTNRKKSTNSPKLHLKAHKDIIPNNLILLKIDD